MSVGRTIPVDLGYNIRQPMHEEIAAFIRTSVRKAAQHVAHDTPLFSSGIVDSFGVLELIAFLEDTYHVDIDPSQHELLQFDTIDKIVALVGHLKRAPHGQ